MSKHTPGPWSISGSLDEDNFAVVDADTGDEICEISQYCGYSPVNEANARLIAAAPELARIGREIWQALDEVRCRDARLLGSKLRALHSELGRIVAEAEGNR